MRCHQVIALEVLRMIRMAAIASPDDAIGIQIAQTFRKVARNEPHGWGRMYLSPCFSYSLSFDARVRLDLKPMAKDDDWALWKATTTQSSSPDNMGGEIAARNLHNEVSDLAVRLNAFLKGVEVGPPGARPMGRNELASLLMRDDAQLVNRFWDPVPKDTLECRFRVDKWDNWDEYRCVALLNEDPETDYDLTARIWTPSQSWRLLVG